MWVRLLIDGRSTYINLDLVESIEDDTVIMSSGNTYVIYQADANMIKSLIGNRLGVVYSVDWKRSGR